jgi:hypothetical protein
MVKGQEEGAKEAPKKRSRTPAIPKRFHDEPAKTEEEENGEFASQCKICMRG